MNTLMCYCFVDLPVQNELCSANSLEFERPRPQTCGILPDAAPGLCRGMLGNLSEGYSNF